MEKILSKENPRTTPRTSRTTPSRLIPYESCEDVSGETLTRGISEPGLGRMSQTKLTGPPQVRASLSPELRGCLRRDWLDLHVHGISGPIVGSMSPLRLAGPPRVRVSPNPELRGCRMPDWPDYLSRGISETRVARTSEAKLAGALRARNL